MGEGCVGLVSPGAMGAAVGRSLVDSGRRVMAVLTGRSERTRQRAESAGIEAVDDLEALARRASVIVSIVPPASASEVARSLAGAIRGVGACPLVVEANAVSPEHAAGMARLFSEAGAVFVDADLIGGPPGPGRPRTRLYLSGAEAGRAAAVLETPELRTIVLDGPPMAASSLKMAYAAWTKGSAALLLTSRVLARSLQVEAALLAEWEISQPDLAARCETAAQGAGRAWRFAAEMEEIGTTHLGAGLPDGFALAAAEMYRRLSGLKDRSALSLDEVLTLLLEPG